MPADPWSHERVKNDRRQPVKKSTPRRKVSSRSAAPSRRNTYLIMGVGIGGWLLYSLLKNTANAAPAGGGSGSAGALFPNGTQYTAGALNASVPGVSFAPSTLQPGILTSTLTGVPAVTGVQAAAAQNFWSTLQPVAAIDSGYITFPSGSQVAAALMSGGNTAMDGNGNYYVAWAGQVYMLGSQDSAGNWPAALVG